MISPHKCTPEKFGAIPNTRCMWQGDPCLTLLYQLWLQAISIADEYIYFQVYKKSNSSLSRKLSSYGLISISSYIHTLSHRKSDSSLSRKIISSFLFLRKTCHTKHWNSWLHEKSEQLSSLSRNPLITQTHPNDLFRWEVDTENSPCVNFMVYPVIFFGFLNLLSPPSVGAQVRKI